MISADWSKMDDRNAEQISIALSALTLIGIVAGFCAPLMGLDALGAWGFGLVFLAGFRRAGVLWPSSYASAPSISICSWSSRHWLQPPWAHRPKALCCCSCSAFPRHSKLSPWGVRGVRSRRSWRFDLRPRCGRQPPERSRKLISRGSLSATYWWFVRAPRSLWAASSSTETDISMSRR